MASLSSACRPPGIVSAPGQIAADADRAAAARRRWRLRCPLRCSRTRPPARAPTASADDRIFVRRAVHPDHSGDLPGSGRRHPLRAEQESQLLDSPGQPGMRATTSPPARSVTSMPSRTTKRPSTIVCQADTGPQRSQASTGRPAHRRRPARRAATRRRRRPRRARSRRSHRRDRGSRRRRAWPLERHPRRCRRPPRRAASRAASPDEPPATATRCRPTTSRRRRGRRARRRRAGATTGAMPDDRIRLLLGQWATPTPAAPSRTISSSFGITQCATHVRSVHQPGALEVLHRAAAERGERERVVLGVLGEVGVQTHVEALGELGRCAPSAPR